MTSRLYLRQDTIRTHLNNILVFCGKHIAHLYTHSKVSYKVSCWYLYIFIPIILGVLIFDPFNEFFLCLLLACVIYSGMRAEQLNYTDHGSQFKTLFFCATLITSLYGFGHLAMSGSSGYVRVTVGVAVSAGAAATSWIYVSGMFLLLRSPPSRLRTNVLSKHGSSLSTPDRTQE